MKISVIEDDQRVSELIQRGSEEQGYTPTLACDGLSSKKLVQQNDYDMIINSTEKWTGLTHAN